MTQYSIVFSVTSMPEGLRATPYWGSIFHGMLVEHLSAPMQELLHEEGLRPFSQWIETKSATDFIWHLNIYSEQMDAEAAALFKEGEVWHSKHLNADFKITQAGREEMTLQQYMKYIFTGESAPERLKITFRTTTSHKVDGQYSLFPSVELMGRSLRRHLLEMDPNCVLGDDGVLDDILMNTRIVRYDLRSSSFPLEGARVYGYIGSVELSIKGPDALRRLAHMLFGFAQFSGIGIKTALGMGGCLVEQVERRAKNG